MNHPGVGIERQLHVFKQKTSIHLISLQKNLRLYQEFKTVQTL